MPKGHDIQIEVNAMGKASPDIKERLSGIESEIESLRAAGEEPGSQAVVCDECG